MEVSNEIKDWVKAFFACFIFFSFVIIQMYYL